METQNSLSIPTNLPVLYKDEVRCHTALGKGSFCIVQAVRWIRCKTERNEGSSWENENDTQEDVAERKKAREGLHQRYAEDDGKPFSQDDAAQHPELKPPPRYALKQLRPNLDQTTLNQGLIDIETELRMLTLAGPHPNIIELAGVGLKERQHGVQSVDFLIIERLRTTLVARLKVWKEKLGLGVLDSLGVLTESLRDLWLDRLLVLEKISGAVCHLHQQGIVYRDLKPDNVGFDLNNTPKLFDFGLARSLPSESLSTDEAYDMTGDTGSRRYMAPEVALEQPYGRPADIYSFAILMHEVLSLTLPFSDIRDSKTLLAYVSRGGMRPPIDSKWPKGLVELFNATWNPKPSMRLSAKEVQEKLQKILRGPDDGLFPQRKRLLPLRKWTPILQMRG